MLFRSRERVFRDHGIDSLAMLRRLHAAGDVPELISADVVLVVDGTGQLRVFAFGYFPDIEEGEKVEVCGKFLKLQFKANKRVYRDELVAKLVLRGPLVGTGAVDMSGGEISLSRARGRAAPR